MRSERLERLAWSPPKFGQALFDLARASKLGPRIAPFPVPPEEALSDFNALERWFEAAAEYYGAELEAVETSFSEIEKTLATAAPYLLLVPAGDRGGILAVVKSSPKELVVLRPGMQRERVPLREVADVLRASLAQPIEKTLREWTDPLPLSPKKKAIAVAALRHQMIGQDPLGNLLLLRAPPGSNFAVQLHLGGGVRRLAWFVVIQIASIILSFMSWGSLFDAALKGKLETSPLAQWVLLTLTVSILEIARSWLTGRLGVTVGTILKRRVLAGALRMDPTFIRLHGSGGILALISEAESLESAGVGSTLGILSAVISLASAGFILYQGAGGVYHLVSLVVWAIVIAVVMGMLNMRTVSWTDFRIKMTNGLVERMVGHRTRMAQESPLGRHRAEDSELELYMAESSRMDALSRFVSSLPSRGWLVIGFAMLLPPLWTGAVDTRLLLLSLGGLFTAQSAFGSIGETVSSMIAMKIAWKNAGPLFNAAARVEPYGLPSAAVQEIKRTEPVNAPATNDGDNGAVLEARNVSFRYNPSAEPVLQHVSIRIAKGDRILLEGSSGGGKSTLAGLLAGLRSPDTGLVLHHGLDRATLGTTIWRQKIASVPQFHENHILSSSLLFNLLLGRRWPPRQSDRFLAQEVCESLGLGPLLARMPSGLEQVVGETGWQLSHGERTRVFLARALLQGSEVILVDESFGALDPHTMRTALEATFKRASTLIVIAHP